MKTGLYIVSTPIGNLNDISSRATNTLNNSDIIICENPKHSLKLLSKLGIKKKLISLHDYNEEAVIENLKNSFDVKKISLISDAGAPLISDPGYKLVRYCKENGIHVTTIPGPSSIISALQLSSIPINKFIFHGFLPKNKKGVDELIDSLVESSATSVFFVSRHKILQFLEEISKKLHDQKIAVCKELTKMNENVFVGLPQAVLQEFKEKPKAALGEFVVVVEGNSHKAKKAFNSLDPDIIEVIKRLLKSFSLTETVEIVHKIGNINKNEIYKKALELKNEK